MKIAIHQPNFIPWIGYFAKIYASDVFVFLDDVQYTKNSLINRNKIKINNSAKWLTTPVRNESNTNIDTRKINEVEIDNRQNWKKKHLMTLNQYYKKTPGYLNTMKMIEDVYSNQFKYLYELNIEMINRICSEFYIQRKMVLSSSLNINTKSTERIVDIVKNEGGDIYVSGHGAKAYQDEAMFAKNNIELYYIDVSQATYPQQGSGFIPSLSVIDYLFNVEKPNRDILSYKLTKAENEN